MGHPSSESLPEIIEQLHIHNLQLILRSTYSFLTYHSPHIKQGRSLRILDLALITAIADLEQLDDLSLLLHEGRSSNEHASGTRSCS